MNSANLLAKLNLAWNLFIHLIKWPFTPSGQGYRQFMQNYSPEGLLPLTREDKDRLASYSRCFNCGLCDAKCPALLRVPREKFPGPAYLVTTLTRTFPNFDASDLDFSLCESCSECERVCPNQVPIKDAFDFLKTKSQQLRVLLPASSVQG